MTDDELGHVLACLSWDHREELGRVRAQLVLYREFIEDHGLMPPDASGEEALTRFRHAFQVAGLNDTMQHPELLAGRWRAA